MTGTSERLKAQIGARGPISFARFMEEALYGVGGYYRQARSPIGADGDFVTSSSSRLFARSTASVLAALEAESGEEVDFLEVGYGDGSHLAALLATDAGRRLRRVVGCERGRLDPPVGVERLKDVSELESRSIRGMVFSYELFDALPVHRVIRRGRSLRELFVDVDTDGRFVWREGELSDAALASWNLPGLMEGQIADVSLRWSVLYLQLAEVLERGLMVTFDYGYRRAVLLDPRVRPEGTACAYRRQRAHRDLLAAVGRQDLTAHVDFTALIEAGESVGLETVGLFSQAEWLVGNGLLEGASERSPQDRAEALALTRLDGVGTQTSVLVQSKGVTAPRVLRQLMTGPRDAGDS